MADQGGIVHKASATETAQYISQMTRELMQLALDADLASVAYMLEMAREEAAMAHADGGLAQSQPQER